MPVVQHENCKFSLVPNKVGKENIVFKVTFFIIVVYEDFGHCWADLVYLKTAILMTRNFVEWQNRKSDNLVKLKKKKDTKLGK